MLEQDLSERAIQQSIKYLRNSVVSAMGSYCFKIGGLNPLQINKKHNVIKQISKAFNDGGNKWQTGNMMP